MLVDFAHAVCVPLETERLLIQPLTGAHAECAFAHLQDDALYQWISMNRPASAESLRGNWTRVEARVSPDGTEAWPAWAVVDRSTGQMVGEVDACIDARKVCTNFGYYFFPAFWGHGFATEAVKAAVDHLLGIGVTSLAATVTVGNLASACVLKKCGFAFTRIIPNNDNLRGTLVDDEEYVLNSSLT